jgi:hypothetical protein
MVEERGDKLCVMDHFYFINNGAVIACKLESLHIAVRRIDKTLEDSWCTQRSSTNQLLGTVNMNAYETGRDERRLEDWFELYNNLVSLCLSI